MKILLDENIPHALRPMLLPMHDVFTVTYLGWNGIENGDLLTLAASKGFDAVITTDRGMEHEQNALNLPCAVFILHARGNKIDDLRPLVPRLLIALQTFQPRSIIHV